MDESRVSKLLKNCSRCGSDHANVEWKALARPIEDIDGTVWTHWAPCPTNGDPILFTDAYTQHGPTINVAAIAALFEETLASYSNLCDWIRDEGDPNAPTITVEETQKKEWRSRLREALNAS